MRRNSKRNSTPRTWRQSSTSRITLHFYKESTSWSSCNSLVLRLSRCYTKLVKNPREDAARPTRRKNRRSTASSFQICSNWRTDLLKTSSKSLVASLTLKKILSLLATCSFPKILNSLSSWWLPSKANSCNPSKTSPQSLPNSKPSLAWRRLLRFKLRLWRMLQHPSVTRHPPIKLTKCSLWSKWWLNNPDLRTRSSSRLVRLTKTKSSNLPFSTTVKKTPRLPSTCSNTWCKCNSTPLPLAPCEWVSERTIRKE